VLKIIGRVSVVDSISVFETDDLGSNPRRGITFHEFLFYQNHRDPYTWIIRLSMYGFLPNQTMHSSCHIGASNLSPREPPSRLTLRFEWAHLVYEHAQGGVACVYAEL